MFLDAIIRVLVGMFICYAGLCVGRFSRWLGWLVWAFGIAWLLACFRLAWLGREVVVICS